MGDLYRSASHVLFWLGEADEDTPIAMTGIASIATGLYSRMLESIFADLQNASLETISNELRITQANAPEWKAIEALYS